MTEAWEITFHSTLNQEIDELFENLCNVKAETWNNMQLHLKTEQDFSIFLSQYQAFFHNEHRRLSNLILQEQTLRQKLSEDSAAYYLIDNTNSERNDNIEDIKSDQSNHTQQQSINFDAIKLNKKNTRATSEISNSLVTTVSLRKQLLHDLRWIYHPTSIQDSENSFLKERSSQITQLQNNSLYDAIDVFLRIPFLEKDKILWYQPLQRGSADKLESISERWFRFRLWYYLCVLGHSRMYELRSIEKHELFPLYQKYSTSDKTLIVFLQDAEDIIRDEIQQIANRVKSLQKELDNYLSNNKR